MMTIVVQEDREAAADYTASHLGFSQSLMECAIRQGVQDRCDIVQAFARHRHAAQMSEPVDPVMRAALQDIADAEAIPDDAQAFVWCRDVARAAIAKATHTPAGN